MAKIAGVDGKVRLQKIERELNQLAVSVFGTPGGARFLDYLRSISTNVAAPADVSPTALMHLEGQRYLVGIITQRIKQGHKDNANAPRTQDPDE